MEWIQDLLIALIGGSAGSLVTVFLQRHLNKRDLMLPKQLEAAHVLDRIRLNIHGSVVGLGILTNEWSELSMAEDLLREEVQSTVRHLKDFNKIIHDAGQITFTNKQIESFDLFKRSILNIANELARQHRLDKLDAKKLRQVFDDFVYQSKNLEQMLRGITGTH